MITISAFKSVPDFAKGPSARSARALGARGSRPAVPDAPPRAGRSGEAGVSRAAALRAGADLRGGRLRPLRNRGHRPHIGERSEALLPKDALAPRPRDAMADRGAQLHRALRHERRGDRSLLQRTRNGRSCAVRERWSSCRSALPALSTRLGDRPYLDGDRFTAGDLMMTTVLRILKHTDIVTSDERLAAYIDRCTARPAFKRAFDAQVGDIEAAAQPAALRAGLRARPQSDFALYWPGSFFFTVVNSAPQQSPCWLRSWTVTLGSLVRGSELVDPSKFPTAFSLKLPLPLDARSDQRRKPLRAGLLLVVPTLHGRLPTRHASVRERLREDQMRDAGRMIVDAELMGRREGDGDVGGGDWSAIPAPRGAALLRVRERAKGDLRVPRRRGDARGVGVLVGRAGASAVAFQ